MSAVPQLEVDKERWGEGVCKTSHGPLQHPPSTQSGEKVGPLQATGIHRALGVDSRAHLWPFFPSALFPLLLSIPYQPYQPHPCYCCPIVWCHGVSASVQSQEQTLLWVFQAKGGLVQGILTTLVTNVEEGLEEQKGGKGGITRLGSCQCPWDRTHQPRLTATAGGTAGHGPFLGPP